LAARDPQLVLVAGAVARLRAAIVAVVTGMVAGFGLFAATVWLLIKGGPHVGRNLNLLGNYYPGYSVTWTGAFVGFFYGTLTGALLGWCVAWLYNVLADWRANDA
jgi:hypothetical protein